MASNNQLRKRALELADQLGTSVALQGKTNDQLQEIVDNLEAQMAARGQAVSVPSDVVDVVVVEGGTTVATMADEAGATSTVVSADNGETWKEPELPVDAGAPPLPAVGKPPRRARPAPPVGHANRHIVRDPEAPQALPRGQHLRTPWVVAAGRSVTSQRGGMLHAGAAVRPQDLDDATIDHLVSIGALVKAAGE